MVQHQGQSSEGSSLGAACLWTNRWRRQLWCDDRFTLTSLNSLRIPAAVKQITLSLALVFKSAKLSLAILQTFCSNTDFFFILDIIQKTVLLSVFLSPLQLQKSVLFLINSAVVGGFNTLRLSYKVFCFFFSSFLEQIQVTFSPVTQHNFIPRNNIQLTTLIKSFIIVIWISFNVLKKKSGGWARRLLSGQQSKTTSLQPASDLFCFGLLRWNRNGLNPSAVIRKHISHSSFKNHECVFLTRLRG